MREIDVTHPAAKSMIELSKTQDEEVGDGTTSVIILGMVLNVMLVPVFLTSRSPTSWRDAYCSGTLLGKGDASHCYHSGLLQGFRGCFRLSCQNITQSRHYEARRIAQDHPKLHWYKVHEPLEFAYVQFGARCCGNGCSRRW